jgi:tetratricopeptide (TPR) repeat protein
MVKLLPKIRGKRIRSQSKIDETSSSHTSEPARKSLQAEIDDDERTYSLQESPSQEDSAQTPSETKKSKLSRHERLAAQRLAKERERTARAAATLDKKGNSLFERGNFDKAMICYSKALKLKRRTFTSMLEEADDMDEKYDKKLSKTDSQVLVSMATSMNNIGYLRQRSGEATTEETMIAYQKSLRIKRRILGDGDLSVGKTLNNIGSVYYLTRNFEGALNAYKEAVDIMQSNLGEYHPDIATVMSNMGDVHFANGQDDESLQQYRLALNIRYANFGKHDPRVVRLLEKIARIEIGDKMIIPTDSTSVDFEENALTDLGMKPLQAEFHLLKSSLTKDMEYVDLLQKKMAVDMVRDKVVMIQGMREVSDSQRALGKTSKNVVSQELRQESDIAGTELCPTINRDQALKHVNYRLAKIRSLRTIVDDGDDASTCSEDNMTRPLQTQSSNSDRVTSFYSGIKQKSSLKSTNKAELQDGLETMKSLRSLNLNEREQSVPVLATSS